MRAETKDVIGLHSRFVTLKNRKEFDTIYKQGNRWHGRFLIIFFVKSAECRVGFTVSKKVGSAVVRNRIRRQLREIYRCHFSHLQKGDIVIVAKLQAAEGCFAQMNKDLLDAGRYFGLLRPKRKSL